MSEAIKPESPFLERQPSVVVEEELLLPEVVVQEVVPVEVPAVPLHHSHHAEEEDTTAKKRVRLTQEPPTVNVFPDDTTESDRDLIWWQQEDFDNAKASVKRLCRGLRQERRFSGCLTDAYEKACCMERQATAAAPSSQNDEQETTLSSLPIDAQHVEVSDDLSSLFHDQGPRGLERLSSRLHAIRRQRHLQEIKHAVFLEQARQQITKQKNAERLAQHAENASRNARAFATFLGKADAWAVKNDDEVLAAAETTSESCSSVEATSTAPVVDDRKPAATQRIDQTDAFDFEAQQHPFMNEKDQSSG